MGKQNKSALFGLKFQSLPNTNVAVTSQHVLNPPSISNTATESNEGENKSEDNEINFPSFDRR